MQISKATTQPSLDSQINKETEDNSEAVAVGATKIQTMRSKEDESQHKLNEEAKNEMIKESDGAMSASKLKSSTMKRDADVKTIERHTSQYSNQDYADEGGSNFGRTISKVSNSRVLTTKRSKQFLLRGKKGIKEELQMIQEMKELEKEKEALEQKNDNLNEKIDEINREALKWKSIMSQKIVYLEDQIKKLKTANIQAIDNLKKDYSKDIMKVSKLAKQKEQTLIENIKDDIESEYKKKLDDQRNNLNNKLNFTRLKLDQIEEKYEQLVSSEKELREEYNRIVKKRELQDFKKNWYGTFTIGFEDRNVTLEKFKHHLKISLEIENTDFQIHCLRNERIIGATSSMITASSTIFNGEEPSNELTKIYVSFNLQNNYNKKCELVNLLKTQIKEGSSKLNFINPFYIGINYGKISKNNDEYAKVSLDKCDLIFKRNLVNKICSMSPILKTV